MLLVIGFVFNFCNIICHYKEGIQTVELCTSQRNPHQDRGILFYKMKCHLEGTVDVARTGDNH